MELKELKPRKALNKAYLKVKPNRAEVERFKTNLVALLDGTNDTESEEFHKNLVIDFLKKTYYDPNHFVNTKGRNDLVIHNGNIAKSSVGVIIEAKKPTNKAEMVTARKINTKAFQELVLYYLRERITQKNFEVKHLVVTNINEWFIFDATLFDRLFAQNKNLIRHFNDFEGGRLADTKTDFFYKQIAEPFIDSIATDIEFTYFNLQDFQKPLRNSNKADDNSLIALFKLLSPEHLLKLPFNNDSNSLDKRFYSELLHIIGLTETKEGSKKLIERNKVGERHTGTMLEDAIIQLDSLDKLGRLEKPAQFGSAKNERLFNVALELSITWINRILFLKLLEAQLITYHKGDKSYSFLNLDKIKNYDDLNSLFFQVLARKYEERNDDVKKAFEKTPYLNSSLFEPTDIEQVTLFISNLKDDKAIPIFSQTVLKDQLGKKRTGNLSTLEYLFSFLDAYDFGSEGSEEIQEDNKALINASVLGLIFEKINGYKDGSFFTPGFITMYMCRETIRKSVIQKFNEVKKWNCNSIEDLYDKIEDRKEANRIVNSIRICDPAVGSGHFLVSALNELIAVKNDLKILLDRDGKRMKEYQVEVVNDELIVTDEEGELFDYVPNNKESQRVQEALFHEKQTIIENCLFGVDINSNSVKICRLRLWIELLKNAYYKSASELETLPNIDINIKCGNSLVSRFAIDADLKQALRKSKWTIDGYRIAVDTYRNAQSKEQKREMERLIADIKSDFRSEISLNDPKVKSLQKVRGELLKVSTMQSLFDVSKKEKVGWNKKVQQLTDATKKLEAEIEEIKANKIFENAFEWRFEFPEVLDDDGNFLGFDVVIGNPPYIRQEEIKDYKPYFKSQFKLYTGTADVYVFFVEKGFDILKDSGVFTFIMPNKFMQAGYGQPARRFLLHQNLIEIIDFGDFQIFEEATTYPCILTASKEKAKGIFRTVKVDTLEFIGDFPKYISNITNEISHSSLNEETWVVTNSQDQSLLQKVAAKGRKLGDYVSEMGKYGIKTGLTEAFVVEKEKAEVFINSNSENRNHLRPFLLGREVKSYVAGSPANYLIKFEKGFTRKFGGGKPEGWFEEKFPELFSHLKTFEEKAKNRTDKGDFYWELRACDYYDKFEKPKIMYQVFQVKPCFIYDEDGVYCNNSMWFIVSDDKVLLGILNSKMGWWLISKYCTAIQNGYQLIWKYFSQLPIAIGNVEVRDRIRELVDEILLIKKHNPATETSNLESKIDQLVYMLYELTEEDIKIVEST
ncbi:Eco57I restriction-modification methylase domain-containing protein [Paraflavitalea sp. CAU 1676]|uniref:class I SAM-dependent DNA methyltransferase n=1 Tax=Paraflavitalea sp. CAU 1676 TaxID=3032598 RepID=UPI0023DAE8B4|nr:Eco57I restriction-modification methylase domain-containing protein [Paraflavitalea sp. CAU 1676]MDF2186815.1 Eco57I restriction-modification methylase domain-containing protein [Paraflavitalea sp. CAU 1676]